MGKNYGKQSDDSAKSIILNIEETTPRGRGFFYNKTAMIKINHCCLVIKRKVFPLFPK